MTTARVGIDIIGRDSSGPAFESAINRIRKLDASAAGMINRQKNLSFQLFDVFSTLGNGANPITVLLQQGPQIAQIYGFGNGGVAQAFKDVGSMMGVLARRVGPIALIGGAIAAGLTYEVNRASNAGYKMGEVFSASWDVIAAGAYSVVQPAVAALSPWVTLAADFIVDKLKWMGDRLIGVNVAWTRIVARGIRALPSVFKDVGMMAADYFIGGIQNMINWTIGGVNTLVTQINKAFSLLPESVRPGSLNLIAGVELPKFNSKASIADFKSGFMDAMGDAWKDINTNYIDTYFIDPLKKQLAKNRSELARAASPKMPSRGSFGSDIKAKSGGGAADNVSGAFGFDDIEQQVSVWSQIADIGKSKFTAMFNSILDGSASVGKAFKTMATSMLTDATKMFANQALQQLFAPRNDLYGSGGIGFGSSIFGSLFGGLFGGARAGGGSVSGGKGYLVGENGPEFFQPGGNGFITPNHAMVGGGVKVTINNHASNVVGASVRKDSSGELVLTISEIASRIVDQRVPKMLKSNYGIGRPQSSR